jgi:hypothetical protein
MAYRANEVAKRLYIIQQKLSENGVLTLHPETVARQVIQETGLRFIQEHQLVLGGTYTPSIVGQDGGEFVDGTDAATWSAKILQGSQTGNITLTLPTVSGTLALVDDIPDLNFQDGLLDGNFDRNTGTISLAPYTTAAAGHFSSTTNTTASATNLAYSGNFYTNSLYLANDANIPGNLNVNALSSLDGGIDVNNSSFTVSTSGAVYAASTLQVNGTATLASILYANGGIDVDSGTFTVQDITGNIYTAGSLEVDGTTNLDGVANVNNTLNVTGLSNLNGGIAVDTNLFTVNGITGAVQTASTLDVTGLASLDGGINVNNLFEVSNTGVTDILAALNVTGLASLDGGIDINGNATIGTNGNIVTAGDLAVNGGDFTTTSGTFNLLNKNLNSTSADQFYTVNIAGGSDIEGGFAINRTLNLGNNLTDVVIDGNLIVHGTNTILNTETVTTNDDILQLRSSATVAMTGYAGLVATKYDGLNDGALVFDNSGTAWVGDVTINPDGTITDISMQPMATRDEVIVAGNLVKWDAAANKLVDQGDYLSNNQITINPGTDLITGGSFTLNQHTNKTITLGHANITRTNTTGTAVNISADTGGSFSAITGLTSSATGHITAVETTTVNIPTPNDATITLTAGDGLGTGGTFTTNQGTNATITFINTDKGSSQNIFKNITDGTNTAIAANNNDTVTFADAGPITASVNPATKTVTYSHDTSSQASVNNSLGTVIQDITLDSYGHITAIGSYNLDNRYHTEAEVSVLNVTGSDPVVVSIVGKVANIELDTAYGDTQNPYGSKAANQILASPNGTAGTPSFRSLVNADLPDSGVVAGTYTAVSVNSKGLVTAGGSSIEVGDANEQTPSSELMIGGLFFLDVEAPAV